MSEQFGVAPSDLRATSRRLGEVSERMMGVLSVLREDLAAVGPAWGGDEIGEQFAKGEAGYLVQRDWVEGSVEAKTGLLDFYSRGLKTAADSFERQDQG